MTINRREAANGGNVWLGYSKNEIKLPRDTADYKYQVLETEEAVGRAMFDELAGYANENAGDINIST